MISEYRKSHIWAVADLMRKYAIDNNMSKQEQDELYTLGVLHDIGYAFLEEKDYFYHNVRGGNSSKVKVINTGKKSIIMA
ncbi:MAG: HD domain-containing protein [Clostridia bacterium]|nr:HD domain-containing protein [Clostridia bacterium]